MIEIPLSLDSVDDYRMFLKIKRLPKYSFVGRMAYVPDEYAGRLGLRLRVEAAHVYCPIPRLFDYQRDITALAIRKQKFAVFADCGLGKTLIELEYARHVQGQLGSSRRVLIVTPLMVVKQTIQQAHQFYGDSIKVEQVRSAGLNAWLASEGDSIGITNWDALSDDVQPGRLGALILDESSMLKSHYGKWGTKAIELGKGLEWKLALSGTPAPNDRIEYANHAVFLDAFPTVNSFLGKFFVNRGQTDNRWELKPHALTDFYRALSHWCIFLSNPATYGWKDNAETIPGINVHIHDVELTVEQQSLAYATTGRLFADKPGGIGSRSVLSQIAKGNHRGQAIESRKPEYIKALVESWPDESTIIWCIYNPEQERIAATFPDAANIDGSTPIEKREELVADFQAGRRKILISKGKILGFGLNLQIATRQVFSGLQDSYETFYQCVKRSNRYGSTRPLNVHIPITEIERPMIETVLRKAAQVEADARTQEGIFKNASL